MENLIHDILHLKEERNATIIAHYYQTADIQAIADFVGDSLAMAKYGKASKADTLIICGVRFMAESAKILSPEKTILLPNDGAGCPMADMVDADDLKKYKDNNPHKYIVSYVNTSADVKALTDVCVTSSNALKIVSQLEGKDLLFLPDRNLGSYINSQLNHPPMELWNGFCLTHDRLQAKEIMDAKTKHPNAKVLIHPECDPSAVALGDYVGSTAGIIDFANKDSADTFIIATEEGVLHKLQSDNPEKTFIMASSRLVCKNMKKTTLSDVYIALNESTTALTLPKATIEAASNALETMLTLSN